MLMQSQDRRADVGAWLYVDEITHRTMNDYAFMLARVDRVRRGVSDQAAASALDDIRARLTAGVRAYRVLRPPREDSACRLDEDLEGICAALSDSAPGEQKIGLTLFCEELLLSADLRWRVSLIVSELITNAMKHAFVGRDIGEVAIDVRVVGGDLRIVVSDDGRGAPRSKCGRGTGIVNALVEDLGGAVWRDHAPAGSVVVVMCPLAHEGRRDRSKPTPMSYGSRDGARR